MCMYEINYKLCGKTVVEEENEKIWRKVSLSQNKKEVEKENSNFLISLFHY